MTFSGHRLFVNVTGPPYNPSSFARINLAATEAPGLSQVPLPAAGGLLAAAMLLMGLFGRRSRGIV